MINAIVLAGGQSKRMGKPKPLLRFGDTTFLGQIISVLDASSVDRTTVVLGAHRREIQDAVDLSAADVVINENYRDGQLSSLIAAIESLPEQTEAILMCLVDCPFITVEVVDRIIEKFRKTKSPIVAPAVDGRRGHPVLFSQSLFEALMNAPLDKGAREVVYSNEDKIAEVDISDNSILAGIDTPDDYRSWFGSDP